MFPHRSDCRMRMPGLSKGVSCISVFISKSIFSNYNYLRYKRLNGAYSDESRLVESFTLNLFSSLTSVSISSC